VLTKEKAIENSIQLVKKCKNIFVGSIGDNGYPNIKCMFNMEVEGISRVWLGTNTSSKKVEQFKINPKACIYFVDTKNFEGLMLTGSMKILGDEKSKNRLWREGFEMYYPKGVQDPDYTVLRFVTKEVNYYQGLQNIAFKI